MNVLNDLVVREMMRDLFHKTIDWTIIIIACVTSICAAVEIML